MAAEHFFDLYARHVGQSEVPAAYHRWAAISLLAATLGDRVWVERHRDSKMPPNLYLFLVGSSGTGKEKAVNTAVRYATRVEEIDLYAGRATGAVLLKHLVKHPKLYFVTEELGMSIRAGEQADDLIKIMTKLYGGHDYPITDGTIARGMLTIENPCVNWLAGTTEDWLVRSVSRDAIEGGFFARVVPIIGRKDYRVRFPKILYPEDYLELRERLARRVAVYATIEGRFTLSEEAQKWHETWYRERQPPTEKALEPSFNRADEMIHKLAMILEVASWDPESPSSALRDEMSAETLQTAVRLWEETLQGLPTIIKAASATATTQAVEMVAEILKRAGSVHHTALLRAVGNRGMDRDGLRKVLGTLMERKEVEPQPAPQGQKGVVYRWISG